MGLLSLFNKEKRSLENPRTSLADPAAWLVNFVGGGPSSSGEQVNEEIAIQIATVYSCVRIIAETIASLPLQVFRRTSDGGVEVARDHPIYPLLHDEPNPFQTSYYFRETITAAQSLYGNGYAIINRERGTKRPIELIPIRPERVHPTMNNRRVVYDVEFDNGGRETIPADDMIHFPALGFDGVVGKSPVRLHREALGLARATEKFGGKFFANGARLSGVLSHPATFSSAAVSERIKDQFTSAYAETDWGVAMLEEGMKFEPLSIPNDDAQFLETRKFQIGEIARIFRIPQSMLGEGDERKANVEAHSIDFVTHTMRPWLVRQEQELNRKLFRADERGEYFAEYNLDGLLRGDSAARAQFYRELWQIGAMSQNEIRAKENLNPIADGSRYFVPMNFVPIDRVDDSIDSQTAPAEPEDEPETEPAPDEDGEDDARHALAFDACSAILQRWRSRIERGYSLLDKGKREAFADFFSGESEAIEDFSRRQFLRVTKAVAGGKVADEDLVRKSDAMSRDWLNTIRAGLETVDVDEENYRNSFESVFDDWHLHARDQAARYLASGINELIREGF